MPAVSSFFGPLLIGTFFNSILYGVLVAQVYMYFQTCKKDAPWLRYLILSILILETVNTGFDFGIVWEPLIQQAGSPHAFEVSPWALRTDPLLTSVISTIVQIFLAWRIRRLTKSTFLAVPIVVLAFCSLVGGFSSTVAVSMLPQFSKFSTFKWAIMTWLVSSALCDTAITVSLVTFLIKNKGNFATTDSVINKIIIMTVQTGSITSVAAIADLLVFLFVPDANLQFIWDFSLCKLYSNSLVSTLNARAQWNKMLDPDDGEKSFCHIEELGPKFADVVDIRFAVISEHDLQLVTKKLSSHSPSSSISSTISSV